MSSFVVLVAGKCEQGHTGSIKTAISIPDPLFAAAEKAAAELGVSRSHLYQRALAEYLRGRGHTAVTEALDQVYDQNTEASALDPVLTWLQGASLVVEDGEGDW